MTDPHAEILSLFFITRGMSIYPRAACLRLHELHGQYKSDDKVWRYAEEYLNESAMNEFEAFWENGDTCDPDAEAKRNGDPVGRPRTTDYQLIRDLRRERGWTMRQIAQALKCSLGAVQRALSLAEVADEQG